MRRFLRRAADPADQIAQLVDLVAELADATVGCIAANIAKLPESLQR
jgi:hypothetical protein